MRNFLVTRELAFTWSWRIAIFLLPWQARWFAAAELHGFAWEEGRASVYVSWFFLLTTIVLAGAPLWMMLRDGLRVRWLFVTLLILLTFIQLSLHPTAAIAIFQWWVQVILLFLFFFALRSARVPGVAIVPFFLASLIPSCVVGIWQYLSQSVPVSTLLGMAPHVPAEAGAAVLQLGETRILRSYGVFPHPNIFGGWLVIGISVLPLLRSRVTRDLCALVFGCTLILTFSRAAWLAASIVFILHMLNRKTRTEAFVFLTGITLVAAFVFPQIHSRIHVQTVIEQRSISARALAIQQAISYLRAHPWIGTGPNAEKLIVPNILEPPHVVPLLALLNFGILGCAVVFAEVVRIRRTRIPWIQLFPLLPLILLDHYLWSYWSGMALWGFVFFTLDDLSKQGKICARLALTLMDC